MNGTVILVNEEREVSTLLCQHLSHTLSLEEMVSPEQLFAESQRSVLLHADVVVLGSLLQKPVQIAQQLHSRIEQVPIVILSPPVHYPKLKQTLQISPHLRGEVILWSTAEIEDLPTALNETVTRSRQRRSYRHTIAAAQTRLEESTSSQPHIRHYLDRLLDYAPIGVLTVDPQGTILTLNRLAANVLKVNEQEALGTPISRLFPESEREGLQNVITRCTASNERHPPQILEIDALDEQVRFVEVTAASFTDLDNQLSTMIILQEVTDRLQAEQERKRAEEQIKSLAKFPEENPCPVFRTDKNGTVTYLNEASQVLLQEWEMAVGSCIPKPLLESVSETLTSGSNKTVDVQCGEQFYSFAITPIKDSKYVNLYGTDVTERKQAEENLQRHAEELARSNAELEQYAYIASHDLQEPLRGVAGCLRILERRYKDSLDASAHELITHAVDGACRMQTLIEDLLRYSKVGTRDQHFEPTDCAKILNQTLTALHAPIQEAGAVVTYDTLPEVSYDPTQLMQVFQNLISNALKFRRDASPRIDVGAERRGHEWVLWVQDNGIGIKPEYAERIFVLFQRLHTRAKYSGTGIGLAICKKIVERHHGRIWFESEPGKGSTFFFTIPLDGAIFHEF